MSQNANDLSVLGQFLRSGGHIDCGDNLSDRMHALEVLEQLGYPRGFNAAPTHWRYAYFKPSQGVVHMRSSRPDNAEIENLGFLMSFVYGEQEQDNPDPLDLSELYDWS